MAVSLGPYEKWEGRAASFEVKGSKSATRVFQVITTNKSDPHTVMNGLAGLPFISEQHPDDPSIYCQSINIDNQSDDGRHWKITCQYSNIERAEDPTDDPAIITWDAETFQTPAIRDNENKPVGNSAGEYYDPPVMIDDSRPLVKIIKNVSEVPAYTISYRNTVNSDSFTIDGLSISARQAKIKGISVGGIQERSGIEFRTVSITMGLNPDTWDKVIQDMGFYELIEDVTLRTNKVGHLVTTVTRAHIMDALDKPVKKPAYLDGNGKAITDWDKESAQYNTFKIYPELPYNGVIPFT